MITDWFLGRKWRPNFWLFFNFTPVIGATSIYFIVFLFVFGSLWCIRWLLENTVKRLYNEAHGTSKIAHYTGHSVVKIEHRTACNKDSAKGSLNLTWIQEILSKTSCEFSWANLVRWNSCHCSAMKPRSGARYSFRVLNVITASLVKMGSWQALYYRYVHLFPVQDGFDNVFDHQFRACHHVCMS